MIRGWLMCASTVFAYGLLFVISLGAPADSRDLHFNVRSISGDVVALNSDGVCSAGTLVSFTGPDGDLITLRIVRRIGTKNYRAVRFAGDLSKLVVGEQGE